MSVFEGIFIGDIHLDKLSKLFPSSHVQLKFNEIEKPLNYALKKGIRDVIFLGDVCENYRLSYDSMCGFIKFLHKWDGKLKLHFILGNHDFAEDGVHSLQPFIEEQKLGLFKSVRFYTKQTVKDLGIPVNFCPFPFTEGVDGALNVGHFEVSGSTRDNGRIIKEAHKVSKRHRWVMGHLHTPHDVNKVHYTGTLYQLNFGESLPKYFSHVKARLSGKEVLTDIQRIKVDPAFKFFNVQVNSKSDLKVIEKNKLYLYKLFIHSDYELSEKDLLKYKNVVDVKGFSSKEELIALKDEEFIDIKEQSLILPSATENLKAYLKAKGTDKKTIERCLGIVKRTTKA